MVGVLAIHGVAWPCLHWHFSDAEEQASIAEMAGPQTPDPDEVKAIRFLKGSEDAVAPTAFQDALVSILRSEKPLGRDLRDALANALEPTGSATLHLVLKKRTKGHPTDLRTALKDARIGRRVSECLPMAGENVESAVRTVMKEFGVSRAKVMAAWSVWQKRRNEESESS